MLINISCGPI